MSEPQDLSHWVRSEVDEARIDRALAVVASPPPRRIGWVAGGGALAAAAAVALFFAFHDKPAPIATAKAPLPAASDAAIVLPDGARVTPHADADVRVDMAARETIALTIDHGAADFVVPHVETRRFVVHAGPYDVIDVGTTFRVERTPGAVHVEVREGAVEVRRDGVLVRVVAAHESWDGTADVEAGRIDVAPTTTAPPSATQVEPTVTATVAVKPRATAKELMEQADEARISGKPRDAAAALDALRRQYRSDPRAGIAAFELGRLRLDTLGDPKGAVEALDDALVLAPNASFREDAEARRVEALERSHDSRCVSARDAYAARYPNGVHAADVANRCR